MVAHHQSLHLLLLLPQLGNETLGAAILACPATRADGAGYCQPVIYSEVKKTQLSVEAKKGNEIVNNKVPFNRGFDAKYWNHLTSSIWSLVSIDPGEG